MRGLLYIIFRCIIQLFVDKHWSINQLCIKEFPALERRRAIDSPTTRTICMALNSYEVLVALSTISCWEGTVVWNAEVH